MFRTFSLCVMVLNINAVIAQNTLGNSSTESFKNKTITQTRTASPPKDVSVFSWNISGDAFINEPALFNSLIEKVRPDILLLDEVTDKANKTQLRKALHASNVNNQSNWHMNFWVSGGRQRTVIASRYPIEPLQEFQRIVAYPDLNKARLQALIINNGELKYAQSLDSGISVNGAIIITASKRLLVVSLDLECCGNYPTSWEEDKRRIEVREIRKQIKRVIQRVQVDGIIVAGDLNLVSTVMPLVIISGPYEQPHSGLIAADLTHIDKMQTWTWDGRGTKFPSRVLDLVIYSPTSLILKDGYIFNPELLSIEAQQSLNLSGKNLEKIFNHLPLITTFSWHVE
ncbi:endonuclease/exonuclease/phosphatase family protein [Paraglaciecola aquimarina]|uniref:Endonuclease/exonuclease/phosphatase family protein n=1 Tax=Paraglaciecola aquimarina TaxID=1235557 RepID=A0ABU3SWC8_9ALTE|nr:endonuclease/exonuclease/phosphatase family protein [Paraglaciecola aquimarina]MDU0354309.1 endonuclease/exonuclease/phosphatase family protein [Paraglaciecola aquimarina]